MTIFSEKLALTKDWGFSFGPIHDRLEELISPEKVIRRLILILKIVTIRQVETTGLG